MAHWGEGGGVSLGDKVMAHSGEGGLSLRGEVEAHHKGGLI